MKSCVVFFLEDLPDVAPHWGAWIEIGLARGYVRCFSVAPHWGAWIEIVYGEGATTPENVAPHWGAWIEINPRSSHCAPHSSRTPLGCVD